MNKKKILKKERGITLIALIITIVVLLILAIVTINSVQDRSIIQHAQNATNEYNIGKDKEKNKLGNYLDYLNEHDPNKPEPEKTLDAGLYVDGTLKSVSYCVGCLFDKYAANMTLKVDRSVRSDYVPKGDFTNFFADFVGESFVYTRNNAVILTLD